MKDAIVITGRIILTMYAAGFLIGAAESLNNHVKRNRWYPANVISTVINK